MSLMQNLRIDTVCRCIGPLMLICICSTVAARNITWSGYSWWVRDSGGATQGPGSNIFSNSTENVFVDDNGDLHLRIVQLPNGKWAAAEVDLNQSLSYGTYEWELSSRYDQFATNVVGGLFTYLDPGRAANQSGGVIGNGIPDSPHEIDIEFTRSWGSANLYYTTHDPDIQSPSTNFYQALAGDYTTHRFTWEPDRITWGSYHGHVAGVANPEFPIVEQRSGPNNGRAALHTYTGPVVPKDLNEIPIINFWIDGNNGSNVGPANGQMQEMIIHSFTFTLLPVSADFNRDGTVDGQDFLIWQRGFGQGTMPHQGDANYDGIIDADDLAVWTVQYGGGTTIQAASLVPEPTTAPVLFFISICCCMLRVTRPIEFSRT